MTDHDHDDCEPLPGPRVRLDVYTDDLASASRIAETLARQAAGYAAEGLVAALLVIPEHVEAEADTEIGYEP